MHLPEIALEEALQNGQCALCWLAHRQVLRRVDTLLNEHVTDPQWRQALREGHGFCAHHAHIVLSRANVLSLALIAEDLLSSIPIASPSKRSAATCRCQLCEARAHDTLRSAKLLAQLLNDEQWRTRYEASEGLCLPHLRQVLQVSTGGVHAWLVASETHRWNTLRRHLQEVIRKHDYRFQHEPWGEETSSWRRAFQKLFGVFAEEVPDER